MLKLVPNVNITHLKEPHTTRQKTSTAYLALLKRLLNPDPSLDHGSHVRKMADAINKAGVKGRSARAAIWSQEHVRLHFIITHPELDHNERKASS